MKCYAPVKKTKTKTTPPHSEICGGLVEIWQLVGNVLGPEYIVAFVCFVIFVQRRGAFRRGLNNVGWRNSQGLQRIVDIMTCTFQNGRVSGREIDSDY